MRGDNSSVMAQFGRIDILVNNAARSFLRPLLELREDGWDKIFDIDKSILLWYNPEVPVTEREGRHIAQYKGHVVNG